MEKVRVRYAPSPTGHLHIGGARTALFNYLFAKHHNGDFVFRIEDTDIERNIEGGEASQLENLEWLGIIPDESPVNPNPKYAPYRQMERLDIYKERTQWLLDHGYAYKCFCTPEELEAEHELQTAAGLAPKYNRKCCDLTPEEVASKEAAGMPYTIRVKVPDNEVYEFEDMIRGHVSFESKDIGDWVLVKANGIPTYNYAVVIDDHSMDITHVFRGEEHLSNTPKQLMIYKMFGWDAPIFGHMTLIVNENRKKLSKRDETIMQFVSQYKEEGYLPDAMFNFMALLGWSPEGEQEIFTHDELIKVFDEHRLSKSPSMFDKSKLIWVNNRYIKERPLEEIVKLCKPFLAEKYDLSNKSDEWITNLIAVYHDQLSYGKEICDLVDLFFEDELHLDEEAVEFMKDETIPNTLKVFKEKLEELTEFTKDNIQACIKATQKEAKAKGKMLYMPIRIATTGIMHGPDLASSIMLIGKETAIERLSKY
ncbi:glutamate--tRNA ligase [Beduini massiliensis]|uniref:glutamate--tRNA ligase n=1 Tax=Beduini massiliensis TaxID=1585974 RepID=UPI00059A7D37|nr:glutamate--tRNA ligase [Beduini massiliensis]